MKKIYKPTVTIGIPAYNEETNISYLTEKLLQQNQSNFKLESIIVLSDGSTDQTVDKIKKIKSRYINLIEEKERKGKSIRINNIFHINKTDIIVIVDSDLRIKSKNMVKKLIDPLIKNKKVMLTSGEALPEEPENWVQKTVFAGFYLWQYAINNNPNTEMYRCGGMIRAFKRKLYSHISFPPTSSEDIYPYLYCKAKGYNFVYVKKIGVYFRLPTKYNDYLKQIRRYLKSKNVHKHHFKIRFVEFNYTINFKNKIKALFEYIPTNPLWASLYVLLLIIPKIQNIFTSSKPKGIWDVAESTKKL